MVSGSLNSASTTTADLVVAERATNTYRRDFGGWAMLVDIEFPIAGCWEVTAFNPLVPG
jgi:hypothetical protein